LIWGRNSRDGHTIPPLKKTLNLTNCRSEGLRRQAPAVSGSRATASHLARTVWFKINGITHTACKMMTSHLIITDTLATSPSPHNAKDI
jgi:hypothetical protein